MQKNIGYSTIHSLLVKILDETMYDIIVIGKGLMGAAATRHLVTNFPNLSVAAVGPDEPQNRKAHDGVFASHYDQGRITRILDRSPIWGHLAAKSIGRYATIEAEGSVQFHHKVGCLRVHDEAEAIADVKTATQAHNPIYDVLDPQQTHERFPYFDFGDAFTAFDEGGDAGYVNPRQLVMAQCNAAQKRGATIIRETVQHLEEKSDYTELMTFEGNRHQAKKVLITAGGFSNLLLAKRLAVELIAHNILLAELPPSEIERLEGMPSLITSFQQANYPSLYMLPPIIYPDGKTYIKLGGPYGRANFEEDLLHSREDLVDWFQSNGNAKIVEQLQQMLHTLLPNLQVENYLSHPCLITMTNHVRPYIDTVVSNKIYVTVGGNGASAKSSDEIGRMGAMLCATDEWHSELEQSEFQVVFQ